MGRILPRIAFMLFASMLIVSLMLTGCGSNKKNPEEVKKMEQSFKDFVKKYEERMKPAFRNSCIAYFDASINSSDENWKKAADFDMKVNEILSNKADFTELKRIKESGLIEDSLLKRHLTVLFNVYLGKHIDTAKLNRLSTMQSNLEKKYSGFRTEIGTEKLTDNDVEEILKTSKDSKRLEEVWTSQKKIGGLVSKDIIAIIKLRNEIAKELGFKTYHEMSLKLNDQEPEDVSKLFDELDVLTREAFKKEKEKMDKILADGCGIGVDKLMPWHYQNRFFQEAPKVYNVDLDGYYKDIDIVKTAEGYYQGLNLPIDDLVAKSDLYEKPNKNQHAYCINIDRDARDIRVLCNIKQNSRWMETTLHEYGHALYEKYLDQTLPWDLKAPSHTFTTEAIAMLFGRFATNPQWMEDVIKISSEEKTKIASACKSTLRLQQLVFSRWSQVMYRFEKSLYENPDQDLNKLWWDLVEKYQMTKRPEGRNEPDWATKIHIATSPCYYHNYHLGELFASQLYFTICNKVLKVAPETNPSFVGKPEVGKYLIENVFMPGAKWYWNEMIEKATGEKLTAKYYAKQFVN